MVIKKYINFYKNYMKMFMKSQVVGLFILLIYSLTNIAYPYFFKLIIDDAITNKNLNKLLFYTSIMIILIILSILFKYINIIYFFNLGKKISLHIKNSMVSHIFRYNLSFFKNYKIGEIISILEKDVASMQSLFMNVINDIFSSLLTFIGVAFILFFLNYKIALLSLGISCVYLILQKSFGKSIKKMTFHISVKKGEFHTFSQELIGNISNIQLHNQPEYFKDKYNNNLKEYYETQTTGTNARAKSYMLDGALEGTNLVLVLCYGGCMVLNDELTVGALFALTLYVQKLFIPMVSLINDYFEIKKARISIDRIYQILDREQYSIPVGDLRCKNDYTIHFLNVSFKYNQNHLFSNINLEIKQGEKVGLIGEKGSGKSNLMNLLLKIQDYEEGNIYIGDYNIKNIDDSYYNKILWVKQEPFVFSGSILENLVMGSQHISKEKIQEALILVNLMNDIAAMEQGLNTIIGEKGLKLSSGQAQKLSLARIFLLNDYPIIILNEPSAALDSESEQIILKNIFEVKNNSTIVVITHKREVLKYCNKIIEISNREIIMKDNTY